MEEEKKEPCGNGGGTCCCSGKKIICALILLLIGTVGGYFLGRSGLCAKMGFCPMSSSQPAQPAGQ